MSPVLHPRIWTTILLLLAGAGCAPSLQITHPRPPEIDISGYKKVAVGGIEGEGGSEIQSLLTQALFDSGRFEVLDRAHLGEVIKEQNLSVSDSFAPADAAEVGRLMASTGLVFGEITRRDYKETEYRVKRSCPLGQGGAGLLQILRVRPVGPERDSARCRFFHGQDRRREARSMRPEFRPGKPPVPGLS